MLSAVNSMMLRNSIDLGNRNGYNSLTRFGISVREYGSTADEGK